MADITWKSVPDWFYDMTEFNPMKQMAGAMEVEKSFAELDQIRKGQEIQDQLVEQFGQMGNENLDMDQVMSEAKKIYAKSGDFSGLLKIEEYERQNEQRDIQERRLDLQEQRAAAADARDQRRLELAEEQAGRRAAGGSKFVKRTLYREDGSSVTPISPEEEQKYLAEGFSYVKPSSKKGVGLSEKTKINLPGSSEQANLSTAQMYDIAKKGKAVIDPKTGESGFLYGNVFISTEEIKQLQKIGSK